MICRGKGGLEYTLSKSPFASGGEGEIYNILGQPGFVAKVYKSGKASVEKERKLVRMVDFPPDRSVLSQIAWPRDVLYNNGQFVGFIMQKMSIGESLNVIYEYGPSVKYPDMTWASKIIIAKNICAVLDSIHNCGHVCGDLNPKNISIDPRSRTVVFLDTDSYHIVDSTHTYRCNVGIPEYLPVEIQRKMRGGHSLATVALPTFSQDTDNFALAIHIFQLLMNGAHPYGCAKASGQAYVTVPQPSDNIEKGESPFMQDIPGIKIPIYAPEITILPKKMQELFKRAFVNGHGSPRTRPKPKEWYDALEELKQNLKNCDDVVYHQYEKSLSVCPWCVVDIQIQCAKLSEVMGVSYNSAVLTDALIRPPIVSPVSPQPTVTVSTGSYGTTVSSGGTQPHNNWWHFSKIGAVVVVVVVLGIMLFVVRFTRKPEIEPIAFHEEIVELPNPFPLDGTKWGCVDQEGNKYVMEFRKNDMRAKISYIDESVERSTGTYTLYGNTLTVVYSGSEAETVNYFYTDSTVIDNGCIYTPQP